MNTDVVRLTQPLPLEVTEARAEAALLRHRALRLHLLASRQRQGLTVSVACAVLQVVPLVVLADQVDASLARAAVVAASALCLTTLWCAGRATMREP